MGLGPQNGRGSEPKPSELLIATFGGKAWFRTLRGTRGELPEGFNQDGTNAWPSHTAAEMGSGPDINPTAFARAPVKGVRGWRK